MKLLFIFFSGILLIVAGLFLYTWQRFNSKIHLHAEVAKRKLPAGWKTKTIFVTNQDNQKIAYWYFSVPDPKAIVILIHGYDNPGGKTEMLGHAEYLHNAGYSTVLLDLRAYGESEGNKMTLGINEWKDVEAVYDQIKSLPENKNKKIGFLGVSMGATTALVTAGETRKGDFVIASVPYADFNSLFKFQLRLANLPSSIFYPFMKAAALVEFGLNYEQFTPSTLIKNIKVPVFLISAKRDEMLNSLDAKNLYDIATQPKEYWEANSPHDIFDTYPKEFKQKILSFLQKYAL